MSITNHTFGSGRARRAGLILSAAVTLLALSAANDSTASSQTQTDGFLYSDYLQHSASHSSASHSTTELQSFSVTTGGAPFWRDAVSEAKQSVNELSFGQYLAEEYINGESSAVSRAGDELSVLGWQLGADVIKDGTFSLLEDFTIDGGIRRLDVKLESKTGRGFSNAGIGAIIGLRETPKDAYAAELRGYVGEDERTGLNVGLLYRRAVQGALLGGNVFFDYEDFDGDAFSRWSVGGEVRSGWVDVFGNIYRAGTDPEIGDEVVTYSADGFDLEAHIHSPENTMLAGILGYYHWSGDHGESDESGKFVGFRVTPPQVPVLFEVQLRDGDGRQIGGQLAYKHTFGESDGLNGYARKSGFQAQDYFFVPAERQHTQRITRIVESEVMGRFASLTDLTGEARLRGVGPRAGSTVNVTTDVDLTPLTGANVRITHILQGEAVTLSRPLPWNLPPAVSLTVSTENNVGVFLRWNSGHEVVVENVVGRRGVGIGEDNLRLSETGRVSVRAVNEFLVYAGDVEVSALSGGASIDLTRTNVANSLRLSGEFGVTGLTYQGTPAVLRNHGGRAELALSYSASGALNNFGHDSFTGGNGVLLDSAGMTLTVVGCLNENTDCEQEEPVVLTLELASSLNGTGTSSSSPIRAPLMFSGVIATVNANVNARYSAASGGLLEVSSLGVISATGLSEGEHVITVTAVFGNNARGALVVYVSAGSLMISPVSALPGNGTAASPYRVDSAQHSVAGAELLRLNPTGGFNLNYDEDMFGDNSGLFELNNGVLSVGNRPLSPGLTVVLTLEIASSGTGANFSMVALTVYLETSGSIPLGIVARTDLDSTASNVYQITSLGSLMPNTPLLTLQGGGGSGTNYVLGADVGDFRLDNGVLVVNRQLSLVRSYLARVSVSAGFGENAESVTVVYRFNTNVSAAPLVVTVMSSSFDGNGTAFSPFAASVGVSGIVGAVSASGGSPLGRTSFSGTGDSLVINARGVISTDGAINAAGRYGITVTVRHAESTEVITVYLNVAAVPLVLTAASALSGDGTQASPFVIMSTNDIREGTTVAMLSATGGSGAAGFSYAVAGTVFGAASTTDGNPRNLTVAASSLEPGTTYTVMVTVTRNSQTETEIFYVRVAAQADLTSRLSFINPDSVVPVDVDYPALMTLHNGGVSGEVVARTAYL